MIISQLLGGLGNQMFQYAAAYALADRLHVPCKVDLREFQENPRPYELDRFVGEPQAASAGEVPARPGLWQARAIRLCARYGLPERWYRGHRFTERRPFSYDERFERLTDPTYLVGYYQSERYFVRVADKIRHAFAFRQEPAGLNAEMITCVSDGNSVSVHVRRGDYVSNPHANRYHGTCKPDYYARAFQYVAGRIETPQFFAFSDDPDWVRANIAFPGPVTFLTHNIGESSWEDMRLMSHCRHHVIANSSFSWWGAWLDPRPDKIVVAPAQWMRDPTIEAKDLIPHGWKRL